MCGHSSRERTKKPVLAETNADEFVELGQGLPPPDSQQAGHAECGQGLGRRLGDKHSQGGVLRITFSHFSRGQSSGQSRH